jgi:hypothetical protein
MLEKEILPTISLSKVDISQRLRIAHSQIRLWSYKIFNVLEIVRNANYGGLRGILNFPLGNDDRRTNWPCLVIATGLGNPPEVWVGTAKLIRFRF